MFTGIVETTAIVEDRSDSSLTLKRPSIFDDVRLGASICVSGVCLSVVYVDDDVVRFDVVDETWNKTKLGDLQPGDRVNVERSLRADGRFEGHIVQGHVEGTAIVNGPDFAKAMPGKQLTMDNGSTLSIKLPEDMFPYVIAKGSIAIDGVSLTVASLNGNECRIALIPHTLEQTTLGSLKEGDRVNIETDILGRYVVKRAEKS